MERPATVNYRRLRIYPKSDLCIPVACDNDDNVSGSLVNYYLDAQTERIFRRIIGACGWQVRGHAHGLPACHSLRYGSPLKHWLMRGAEEGVDRRCP